MIMINVSNCPQLIDNTSSVFPTIVHPKMVIDMDPKIPHDKAAFKKFTFEMFKNADAVTLYRKFALGDLIMLVPVARELKLKHNIKNIGIATTPQYAASLRSIFPDISWYVADDNPTRKQGILISLDGVLERDHSTESNEREKHRVDIFAETLGIKMDKCDWTTPATQLKYEMRCNEKMKKIGLQIRGSGVMKTLKKDLIMKIVSRLTEKYTVVLLDHDKDYGFEGKNIINTCGKLNVQQCVAMLTKLDCCITMDSGMLWLAHAANCPVLTILGPTREEERISLHPQYPEKAKAISISKELIGCEPCFETKVHCKGKINCMWNFDGEKLIEMISSKIQSIVGE